MTKAKMPATSLAEKIAPPLALCDDSGTKPIAIVADDPDVTPKGYRAIEDVENDYEKRRGSVPHSSIGWDAKPSLGNATARTLQREAKVKIGGAGGSKGPESKRLSNPRCECNHRASSHSQLDEEPDARLRHRAIRGMGPCLDGRGTDFRCGCTCFITGPSDPPKKCNFRVSAANGSYFRDSPIALYEALACAKHWNVIIPTFDGDARAGANPVRGARTSLRGGTVTVPYQERVPQKRLADLDQFKRTLNGKEIWDTPSIDSVIGIFRDKQKQLFPHGDHSRITRAEFDAIRLDAGKRGKSRIETKGVSAGLPLLAKNISTRSIRDRESPPRGKVER